MSRTTSAVAVSTIGIDTGKNTLHLIGLHERGTIVLREKLPRGRIGGRLANVPPCLIGIEAGMGTHYVARELISLGHDVRQVPPAYVLCRTSTTTKIVHPPGALGGATGARLATCRPRRR